MRSALLMLSLLACAPRKIELRYQTDVLIGANEPVDSRPVLVGLYPLKYVPQNLPESPCAITETEEAVLEALGDTPAGSLPPLSAIPGTPSSKLVFDRPQDARWLLMVPYYQYKCSLLTPGQQDDVDDWAIVRLRRLRRVVWLSLREYQVVLPWRTRSADGKRQRQRGCVDSEAKHALWSWCH